MKLSVWGAVGVLMIALLGGGCASVAVRKDPKMDFAKVKHVYVIHLLTDGRGVDRMIANRLRARGYDATFGPRTEMPQDMDAVVLYEDEWTFDFTTYMIALNLQVRTPRTDVPLAVANVRRPSITGGSPVTLIDKLVKDIFPARPPLEPLGPPTGLPDFGNLGK